MTFSGTHVRTARTGSYAPATILSESLAQAILYCRTYLILWTWRSCNTNLVTYYPMLGAVRKNVARRTTHSENEAFRARGAAIRPQSLSSGVLFSGSFDNTLEWNLAFGTLPLFRDSFIQGTHDLVPEKFLLLIFTRPHWTSNYKTIDPTEILLSRCIRAAEN